MDGSFPSVLTASSASLDTITATKTAVFKIRNPSAWKKAALLDSMKRTHLATHAVLADLLKHFPLIKETVKKTERTRRMQQIAYETLASWSLCGSGSAAARVDAIGLAESYLQQMGDGREKTGDPVIPPPTGRITLYRAALDALASEHASVEREGILRDELARMARASGPRPLSLHGYGHFYRLLRHPKSGRMFAWINLLPKTSRFTITQTEANRRAKEDASGDMVDVSTGEVVRCKKPTWLLFPLEFGFAFHEMRYLLSGVPGGGRIVYRPEAGHFELHASFQYETIALRTDGRFIGVDRGIYNLAAWSAVDVNGRILDEGTISGLDLRHAQRVIEANIRSAQRKRGHVSIRARRAQSGEAVHRTANEIVKAAKRLHARVVIEELTMQRRLRAVPTGNKGGQFGRAARRILGRQQYAKLVSALTYKLAREGLPPPISVGAAFTSQTCPECGYVDAANRVKIRQKGADMIDMSRFQCARCGHQAHADLNAARVIAIKGAWLLQVPTKKARAGRELNDDERFPRYLTDAAMRRGSSAAPAVVPS